jgi:hypothetical protein
MTIEEKRSKDKSQITVKKMQGMEVANEFLMLDVNIQQS